MTPDLRDELRPPKPSMNLRQEAQHGVLRTGAMLTDDFERMLRPYGITATQFNVLRILRGAGPDGLCRNDIRERMLTRMPDITRLLDRMEEAGLVTRTRESGDRRMITTRLTAVGLRLLADLDDAAAEEQQRRFRHLSEEQLTVLIELLTAVRQQS